MFWQWRMFSVDESTVLEYSPQTATTIHYCKAVPQSSRYIIIKEGAKGGRLMLRSEYVMCYIVHLHKANTSKLRCY